MSNHHQSHKRNQPRIALVHDYLYWYGGAEKVLEAMHEIWPDAPVFTSYYQPEKMPDSFKSWDIKETFIRRLPFSEKLFRHYYIFYHHAFNHLDLSSYDIVISSSSGFGKDIITRPNTTHIAYTHTIPRYLWGLETSLHNKLNPLYRNFILPPIEAWFKKNDINAAKRVDQFVANSQAVRKRIKRAYNRDSTVINPPVETSDIEEFCRKNGSNNKGYFLAVGRLHDYKRFDLPIKACNKLGLPLKIVGEGDHRKYLEGISGPSIEFLGFISKPELFKHICNCTALIYPNKEDFGIVAVEAMAAGKPVIGFGEDGLLETVQQGITGEFFYDTEGSDLIEILEKFDVSKYNPEDCRRRAKDFSKKVFKNKLRRFVEELCYSPSSPEQQT